MFNKIALLLGFLTLIALNIRLLYKNKALQSSLSGISLQQMALDSEKIDFLEGHVLLHVKTPNQFGIADTLHCTGLDGKRHLLAEVVNKDQKIVYRVRETNCMTCVERELPMINSLARTIGLYNIILLTTFDELNQARILQQKFNIPFAVYNVDRSFSPSQDSLNFPYVFLLSANLTATELFYPEKSMPDLSERYYRMIADRFADENTLPHDVNAGALDADSSTKKDLTVLSAAFTEYDFRTITRGRPATTSFEIRNTGSRPLLLRTVKSVCGCTVPEWPRYAIPPGGKSVIEVTYDAMNTGDFLKDLYVFANIRNNPLRLRIKGKVL